MSEEIKKEPEMAKVSPEIIPAVAAAEHLDPKKPHSKRIKWIMIVVIVVVVLAAMGGGAFGMVYKYSGTNAVKTWLVNTLPFPVAVVDGEAISLEEFEANVASANFFFEQQAAQGSTALQAPSADELRQSELDRMVDLVLLKHVATGRGVETTNEEVQAYFDENILPQANN
jgi:flagellar basal body-associated protein FliL